MNFNANSGARHPSSGARKPKRVSDVNAMGAPAPVPQYAPPAYEQVAPTIMPQANYAAPTAPIGVNQYSGTENFHNHPNMGQQNVYTPTYNSFGGVNPQPTQMPAPQGAPMMGTNVTFQEPNQQFPQQFSVFQQPIVQDMAMQYGQKLADQGKEIVHKEFEKYIPVTKLKYYFAVDNKYVINKLRLIFFPFTQTDWSLKYDHDNPVQPRYDINAPDLYIPTMAYITYIVLAGLVLGMQNRFSPEQLGIQASTALAYSIFELVIYAVTLYVANIPTTLKTLDLLAFSGYKYASIVTILLISILLKKTGYYIALIYCSIALALFLLRTLKAKVLNEPVQVQNPPTYDPYGQQQQQFEHNVGRKRKLYFLFLVTGLQPVLAFWLSMHLIPSTDVIDVAKVL